MSDNLNKSEITNAENDGLVLDNEMSNKRNNGKTPILGIVISFVFAVAFAFFCTNDVFSKTKTPVEAYRVYLKGESIGLIDSENKLYDYINKMQQSLKEKYNVDKVYVPSDINVVKDVTYEDNLQSISNIYNIINQKSPFTIKGYIAVIDKTNATEYVDDSLTEEDKQTEKEKIVNVNLLNKDTFRNAAKKVMLSFVTEDEFDDYNNDTQKPIVDQGEIIENLYIDAKIDFKEAYLPVNEKIYTSEEELTEYLLFGSNENMSSYTVKDGDTLETIAENNKMNINELLIANANLGDENALLHVGQRLTVGVLNPVFSTIEVTNRVEDQAIKYKTEYKYDNTKVMGYQKIETKGSSGTTRVTQKVKSINGVIVQAVITNKEVIKPVVNEVVIKGGRQAAITSAGNWGWPCNIPYVKTSDWGWRWGRMHNGVDLYPSGGYGSPIYAAKDGIVTEVKYNSSLGNYVEINHQNGYYTRYLHMAKLSPYVKVGQAVKMGQTIGDVGNSGASQGTHLHFEIWNGKPYSNGAQSFNPLRFY